jgi:hypothetical protein
MIDGDCMPVHHCTAIRLMTATYQSGKLSRMLIGDFSVSNVPAGQTCGHEPEPKEFFRFVAIYVTDTGIWRRAQTQRLRAALSNEC